MLTTGSSRGLWSPVGSPLASPVGSPEISEKGGGFARFFKEMKSNKDKDRGEFVKRSHTGKKRDDLLFVLSYSCCCSFYASKTYRVFSNV